MQQMKQQLKNYEQHSQQQLVAQPDADTKMTLLPGLNNDRLPPAVMPGMHALLGTIVKDRQQSSLCC